MPYRSEVDVNAALKSTLALVLAGGRGSRLLTLTNILAKPAMPFAGKYRIIDFPLSNCVNSGIRRIAVLTQYKAHVLIQHIQRGWSFLKAELQEFIDIWPAQQQTEDESWYRGTADAVYQNIETIKAYGAEYILVLAGDHVYKQNYAKMLVQHIKRGADVTVACIDVPIKDAKEFGVVGVGDGDIIINFLEKPADPPCIPGRPDRAFASMGIYIFNADFLFNHLHRDAKAEDSSHDFGKDLLPYLVSDCKLYAHRFADSCVMNKAAEEPYWRDVGTIDAYWKANMDLATITPALDLYGTGWPIWTYQEQRPSAKFIFDDEERRGMAVDSLVSAGCIISGGTVRRSLLFNNVRVNSYSLVEDTVVLPGADIGRNVIVKKALIDSDCKIPAGMKIGVDKKLDAARFHITEGGITMVTKDMLKKL